MFCLYHAYIYNNKQKITIIVIIYIYTSCPHDTSCECEKNIHTKRIVHNAYTVTDRIMEMKKRFGAAVSEKRLGTETKTNKSARLRTFKKKEFWK